MIKTLRIKFVVVSMLSLILVLTVIMGTLYVLNYRRITRDADNLLSILLDNNGTFPKPDSQKADGPDQERPKQEISPEAPYATRYFTVRLSTEDGSVLSVDTGKIAAVDESQASDYAARLWISGKSQGFVDTYRYGVREGSDETLYAFLDCRQDLSTFRSFLISGGLICFLGLASVLVLLIFFSGRVVAPVAESYARQKCFITDAGHEIKTPITIIDADAEVLTAEIGDNEWVRDIQAQTRRLASLTQDLIYLSRMEEGANSMTMIDFPFSDMVSETVSSFHAPAMTGNKQLHVQIRPMISIRGDEKALRQLVTVLMDNALKYCPEHGDIYVHLEHYGKNVQLTITNTASNISRNQLPHLFERFYRGDASHSSQTKGYGIGLSIARAVTAAHRGRIAASSSDGHSLTITVTLPSGTARL